MQTDLFDHLYEDFKFEKDKKIRVVELFSGIGFQRMGMELAKISHEVVATSEIDKFAISAYKAIHGENPNLGSITEINGGDIPKDIDIMTYSFPCTDLSKAGNQKGLKNTRSGLVYEVVRLLEELSVLENLPKVLIMENVVDLVQAKFIDQWNEIQLIIEKLGYSNYIEKLNAKDYGIAQSRNRVFMVSILGDYNYNFPKGFELEYKLKNYFESSVDEKYYLSDTFISGMLVNSSDKYDRRSRFIENCKSDDEWMYSPTITTREGQVATSTFIKIKEATKTGYDLAYEGDSVNLDHPKSDARRGRVGKGVSNTLTTSCNIGIVLKNSKLRKLTPVETGRLMGMSDEQISKQREVMSDAQTYKQHGNGIVANVIGMIIGMLYYDDEKELRKTVMNNSHKWLKGV